MCLSPASWTDAEPDILRLADFIVTLGTAVERVEVLPFHQMGAHKWQELGVRYELSDTRPATFAEAESARALFRVTRAERLLTREPGRIDLRPLLQCP